MGVTLGAFKPSLSLPVILLLIVPWRYFCKGSNCLYFAVEFCAICTVCAFSYFLLSLGNCVAVYWEISAHSAYDIVPYAPVICIPGPGGGGGGAGIAGTQRG